MRECGLQQAAHFSWGRAGAQTAAVYHQALAWPLASAADKFGTNKREEKGIS
jgi:hypothetical protein